MTKVFDDVVVPTDGSDAADQAVDHAIDVATRVEASLHVLSVVSTPELDTTVEIDPARVAAKERVEGVAEHVEQFGIDVTTAVRTGVPSGEILDYADEIEADLVAMGTHGRTGLNRYLIGSVAENVVRRASPPVLTVPPSEEDRDELPYEDLLVPTDGSENAEAALRPALALANAFDVSLHTISVVDPFALGPDVRSDAMLENLESRAQQAVDSVVEMAAQRDVHTVETTVTHGTPHQVIRDYVDERDIDLVALGTHGRTGLKRAAIGSVAERTVRTSPVPVLTVRRQSS